jgi:hypothetical protein
MRMQFKILPLLILLSAIPIAGAQTVNAKSCSLSDVEAALNSANASTATVNIPAGTCTWSGNIVFNVPSGSTSLTIQGQTTCTGSGNPASNNLTCSDNTVIVDALSYTAKDPNLLSISTGPGAFRLTGLTIRGPGNRNITYNGAVGIWGTSQKVRVDHNHWSGIAQLTLKEGAGVAGVFDHNIFVAGGGSIWSTIGGSSSDYFGDAPWAAPTNLGTGNFSYFEDNYLGNGGNDCYQGGRWVIRYNTFVEASGTGFTQTHPTGGAGRIRGCRAWELYGNSFSTTGETAFNAFFVSAGTGVIWGNSANNQIQNFVTAHSMRRNRNTYGETAAPNGWGYCGTSFDGTGSPWDDNTNKTTGYRCMDQPGQGQGQLLNGLDFPNAKNTVTGTPSWPHEALEPVYEWSDSWVGPGYGALWNTYETDALFNNSDYYLWCDASSKSGCTTFDGTEGVGSGTLAARPSTCTTGVAYWATDQGKWNQSGSGGQGELFKCTSTDTWTLFYTPYPYPHPLITGASTNTPPPPTSLTGTVVQ